MCEEEETKMAAGKTILERDLEWLRKLDAELWKEEWMSGRFRSGYVRVELPRRLSDDEWARVRKIVDDHRLPVTVVNTRFGFGVGMVIYEPEREWIYPGVEEESKPGVLTMISQSHLPESESTSDCSDRRIKFEDGWRCFEPLTHSRPNLEVLRRCHLREPGPMGHYVY